MDMTGQEWRKSSRSASNGGDCVELAEAPGAILVRDSKDPGAGHLSLSTEGFAALLDRVKRDELAF